MRDTSHRDRTIAQGSWQKVLCFYVGLAVWVFAQWNPTYAQEKSDSIREIPKSSLGSLRLQFDIACGELTKPISDLQSKYEEQLDQLMDQVTEEGELEKALAIKAELSGYQSGESKAAGDDFPELKRLQKIYSETSKKRRIEMAKRLAEETQAHKARLLDLQKRLTQERKLDDAVAVKSEVEKVNKMIKNLTAASIPESQFLRLRGKEKVYENSLGMKFVSVPVTGDSLGPKTILFSIWETRVRDYESFVRRTKRDWSKPDYKQTQMHPAVMVTWDDAKEFCDWLTEKERDSGKIGLKDRYRLPTDHEWSCAVGIGGQEDPEASPVAKNSKIADIFPWGEAWPPPPQSGNYCGEETKSNPISGRAPIKGYQDGFDRMAPVGKFPANQFGIFDLNGNALELCGDRFDPKTPDKYVMRGGCYAWRNPARLLSSFRINQSNLSRSSAIGFRCVLESGGDE